MFGHDKRSLGQLFDTPVDGTSYSYFQVPQYQRKYDWEKEKQVAKLVDDSFENKGNSYFMGTLITCRAHDHNNSVELIDGQQRLATLAIFLRALADYIYARKNEPEFPEALREKMGEMQYELQSKIIKKGSGKSDEIVIHLPQKINKFFREEIILGDSAGKKDRLLKLRVGQHPSIMRLIDAYGKISESVSQKYDTIQGEQLWRELYSLARSMLDEKQFLVISVNDYSLAYTIFETINTRARPLTLSDLVKNLCFKRLHDLGPTTLDDFENDWDDAEIAVSDFASFMWHAWVSRYNSCPKSAVFGELQKLVKDMSPEQVFELATDFIEEEVKYYRAFENPEEEPIEQKRVYLQMLAAMDATRCYPLLLAIECIRQDGALTNDDTVELFGIITSLTFWHSSICGKDAKKLEATYHELAQKSRKMASEKKKGTSKFIIEEIAKNFPGDTECKAGFLARAITDTNFIKMMLMNIENLLCKGTEKAIGSSTKVWLEHILPRNPDPVWVKNFKDKNDMNDHTYRLGNYTLLFSRLNKEALNKPFPAKKEAYKKSDITLTKQLLTIPEWNTKEINKRGEFLYERAKEIWPIRKV